jgi:hypothetical protein
MAEDNRWREENTARLLRAAFDRSARPDPVLRARTFEQLLARVGPTRPAPSFPDRVLWVLAGGVVLLGVALGALATRGAVTASLLIATLVVGINVLMLPVAAVIVVWNLRRARVGRSHA